MRLSLPEEILQRVHDAPTKENGNFYHIQNDTHRIVWITPIPLQELIGKTIEVTTTYITGLRRRHIDLPKPGKYLQVTMTGFTLPNGATPDEQLKKLLGMAPRNQTTGRKPISPDTHIISFAATPEHIALARSLSGDNISEGMRKICDIAGDAIAHDLSADILKAFISFACRVPLSPSMLKELASIPNEPPPN